MKETIVYEDDGKLVVECPYCHYKLEHIKILKEIGKPIAEKRLKEIMDFFRESGNKQIRIWRCRKCNEWSLFIR